MPGPGDADPGIRYARLSALDRDPRDRAAPAVRARIEVANAGDEARVRLDEGTFRAAGERISAAGAGDVRLELVVRLAPAS